jgi:uncharacterized protein YgiM (DUF1202 family)
MSCSHRTASCLLLILFVCAGVDAAKPQPAWVAADRLRVRSGPGTDRSVIGSLGCGEKVFVTAFREDWCWARLPDGRWGWLSEDYLEFSPARGRKLSTQPDLHDTSGPQPAWIVVANAYVRAGASTDRKALGKLPRGTKVYIVDRYQGWCKVSAPEIERGWIRHDLLETDVETGRRLTAEGTPTTKTKAFVEGEVVHLRAGPGSRFDKVAKLRRGQTLWVTGQEGMWRKVKVHDGAEGWVAAWLIKSGPSSGPPEAEVATAASSESESSSEVLDELKAWIGGESCNVRYGPGMDYDVKAGLAPGTPVVVTDVQGHWCKVRMPSGAYGWVAGWVMNFQGPEDQAVAQVGGERLNVRVGWVARPEVNIRTGPGINYREIAEATFGTQVVIVDQNGEGDWYKVTLSNGKQGWMASRYIDTREQRVARKEHGLTAPLLAGLPRGSPAPNGSIAATARRYLGDTYVRGGAAPGSFDCSGLVQYVHRLHGVNVSRTSRSQYHDGVPVPRSQLAPGDVVFFKNTYRRGISHVGIYIGNDRFIHASNPGSGVKITSLSDPYYAARYVGARRMR